MNWGGSISITGSCSSLPNAIAMCEFARELIDWIPGDAQYSLPVEEYAAILAKLKPHFIHHPKSKQFIQGPQWVWLKHNLLRRAANENRDEWGYLSSGIAYAFHPHRDTVLPPLCQLNWWFPIYDRAGQCYGFPSPLLEPACEERIERLQLYEWNKEAAKTPHSILRKIPATTSCRRAASWSTAREL